MKLPRLPRIAPWIADKLGTPREPQWRVELLDPRNSAHGRRIRLLSLLPGYTVLDTLPMQLADLVATLYPGAKLAGAELERALADARHGLPIEECGTYVHYPWKKELVRVLDRADFIRLRTNRNFYKITPEEQTALGQKTVAVAGLSVGLAVVTTLALERVGGRFHLADFDELALTNLNRLLAGVSELGLPKTVIAARRLFELDPYLDITLFQEGVTRDNVAAFLAGTDLLVEECDDLNAKLFLRELARRRGIPVVMQTSEGGLLDVERFDREPDRASFHGLIGPLHSSQVSALTRRDKVPLVSRIIEDGLSDRCAASMLEIESSVSTWPQLGSAVTAGAGALVDVARRILLGSSRQSGRFIFDPTTSLADGHARYVHAPSVNDLVEPARDDVMTSRGPTIQTSSVSESSELPTSDEVRELVRLATLAPSGGNAQAWTFEWDAPRLTLRLDPSRGTGGLNLDQLANALALGAVAESLVLAAGRLGFAIEPRPDGALAGMNPEGARYASMTFEFSPRADCTPDPLADWLQSRSTNRNHVTSAPLTTEERAAIQSELPTERLVWIHGDASLDRLAGVLAEGDRFRILHPLLHEEMMAELRFPTDPETTKNDGIETSTMDMDAADLVILRLWSRPAVASLLRSLDLGRGIYELAEKRAAHASAALVLRTEGRTFDAFFFAGRELMRLWLRAESRGIQLHPWGALGFLLQHEENDGERATALGMSLPTDLARKYRQLVPRVDGQGEALLFFLHRAPRPKLLARRRPVDDVLTVVGR